MPYILPNENGASIFYETDGLSKEDLERIIFVDNIPEGDGTLMVDDDGNVYKEPFQEPESPTEIPPPTPPPNPFDEMQSQILLNTEMLLIYKELGI